METRVYAIVECVDVHDISNEKFIEMAEELGYVWSLSSFQNFLNVEGAIFKDDNKIRSKFFTYLHFRFMPLDN